MLYINDLESFPEKKAPHDLLAKKFKEVKV